MRSRDEFNDVAAALTLPDYGVRWQQLAVGTRVKPIGQRKMGTVVGVEQTNQTGVTTHVLVRWDPARRYAHVWATDCLIIVDDREGAA